MAGSKHEEHGVRARKVFRAVFFYQPVKVFVLGLTERSRRQKQVLVTLYDLFSGTQLRSLRMRCVFCPCVACES